MTLAGGVVLADDKAAVPAPSSSITTGSINKKEDQAAVEKRADVSGFRSARFGMTEDDVRKAITRDFKVADKDITATENKAERTRVLSVKIPDVLPGGGIAEVTYVFGYQTKKLIQAGVAWSLATDEKMTPEQLLSNANVLRSHFMSSGYKPDTIAMNMPIANGLLMFRGADSDGQTTLLMLQGQMAQAENDQRILTPTSLTLFYVADAKKPDVYRIPDGLF